MTKGLNRSLSRGSAMAAAVKKETVLLTGTTLVIDGDSNKGPGSAVIMAFPEGQILILGCVLDVTCTKTTANITNDWTGDLSIGTVANFGQTISGTDEDILEKTDVPSATDGVISVYATQKGGEFIDNTDGDKNYNFNLLINDSKINGDDQEVDITGYFHVLYSCLGDT